MKTNATETVNFSSLRVGEKFINPIHSAMGHGDHTLEWLGGTGPSANASASAGYDADESAGGAK